MKKIISQILLILLIITIGMTSVFINKSNAASQAGLNVSSATEGGTFNVSLIFPSHFANVSGATATITVIYSDGSKDSQRLVYMEGMSDCPNLVTFNAKVAGKATIKATEIDISDSDSNLLEQGENKEQTITIASKTPPPATTPDPEPEPEKPTTPDPGQSGSGTTTDNNNNTVDKNYNTIENTTTNTNTVTNTVTNTTKEPDIVNPTFKAVNEIVYATKKCNVRSSCSTEINSNKIGSLVKGQSVTRTGVDDDWSRIEYNGKVAYVATRLLTTEEPVEEPENKVNENTISDNTVENNEIEDNGMLNQIEHQIGVLPEVGHNIATIMFVVISILSLIVIMRIEYKSKE